MIKIDVTTDTLTPALRRAAEALEDLTPLMQDIGELMVERTQDNFKTGTAPDGTPWAPRGQITLDAYAARGDTPKGGPLVGVTQALSRHIFAEPDAAGVSWGSNMIYSAVMQFGAAQGAFGTTARGGPIPWGTIPPRPFVGVGPEDESAILVAIEDYFQSLLDE